MYFFINQIFRLFFPYFLLLLEFLIYKYYLVYGILKDVIKHNLHHFTNRYRNNYFYIRKKFNFRKNDKKTIS